MWTSVPPGDNTLSNLSCFHQLFPSSTARLTLEPMMQLLTAVVWALAACQVASETLPFFGSQQTLHGIDDKLDVPGDSPLQYCRQSDDDILVIEHVNLSPNPPVPGQNLSIEAAGIFKKDVEEGAYVNLQVKYGLIRLVNTKADLCSQVEQVDLKCPIKKGETLLTKTVEIPKEVPPGKYTVLADVYTVDDEKITCLTAEVTFPRGS
ncbi:MAG: Phosphatidylglycerol/phosphatidylinositol transfer protein [Thelocarpon superellum]|nr:MAG: Phosphatidylglycerol/phosphatidylinositol transfer protein [Thelocarpon superellum]